VDKHNKRVWGESLKKKVSKAVEKSNDETKKKQGKQRDGLPDRSANVVGGSRAI